MAVLSVCTKETMPVMCKNDSSINEYDPDYPTWLSILLLLVSAVGFSSNILVCVTILKVKFLQDVTHYLILNLAVSDGMCSLAFGAGILMELLHYPNNDTGEFAELLHCHLIFGGYLFQSFAYTSAYNLVTIALERYVGIVTPLKYIRICTKVNTCIAMGIAWLLGFCAYLLHCIGVVYTNSCNFYPHNRCQFAHGWEWHFIPFIAGFMAPLLIMLWAYFQIIKALKQSSANQIVSIQVRETQAATKQVVHFMLMVTVTYIILYIPTQPAHMVLVIITYSNCSFNHTGEILINLIIKFPVLLNSVVNPFIYAFKYKKFRKGIRETLSKCRMLFPQRQISPENDTDHSTKHVNILLRNQTTDNTAVQVI